MILLNEKENFIKEGKLRFSFRSKSKFEKTKNETENRSLR
jgi:hypothetical protein